MISYYNKNEYNEFNDTLSWREYTSHVALTHNLSFKHSYFKYFN